MTAAVVIWLVVMAIGLLTLAAKLWDLRSKPDNPATRWLCVAIAAMLASFAGQLNAVRVFIDGITRPGTDWVAASCAGLVACFASRAFFLHMTRADPRSSVRRWMWTTVAVTSLTLVTFAVFGSNYEEFTAKLSTPHEVPTVGVNVYLYVGYLAVIASGAAASAFAYARLAGRLSLRLGLSLISTGMTLLVGYSVVRLIMTLGYQVGLVPEGSPFDAIPGAFLRMATPLILLGSVLPAWGARVGLDRLGSWLGDVRRFHQLTPLWRAMAEAFPGVVLTRPRRLPFPRAGVAVHRRAVEIWDGRLLLRPFLDDRVAEAVRAAGGDDAAGEAAMVRAALAARAEGNSPAGRVAPPSAPVDRGVEWLARVSRVFSRA